VAASSSDLHKHSYVSACCADNTKVLCIDLQNTKVAEKVRMRNHHVLIRTVHIGCIKS